MFLPGSRRTFSESVYLLLIGSEIWTVNLFLSGLRTIWFAIIESTVFLKSLVADVIKFLVFFWCSRWTRDFICREILSLPLISQSGRLLLLEFILLLGWNEWTLEEKNQLHLYLQFSHVPNAENVKIYFGPGKIQKHVSKQMFC